MDNTEETHDDENIKNVNNEITKMLKKGEVVELKTVDGNTIYMETKGLKSTEIQEIQNSDLEFKHGKVIITKRKGKK